MSAVDDLIKFRLVESMLRQPEMQTSAADLAARLGFHSVELTGMALDELVSAGLLRSVRRSDTLLYWVTSDQALRNAMVELIAAGPPGLFNRLAAASLSRIKNLLKARK